MIDVTATIESLKAKATGDELHLINYLEANAGDIEDCLAFEEDEDDCLDGCDRATCDGCEYAEPEVAGDADTSTNPGQCYEPYDACPKCGDVLTFSFDATAHCNNCGWEDAGD